MERDEIIAEWVKRLRSGDYKQGQKRLGIKTLNGVESFCCLGVLCEMAVEEGVVRRTETKYPGDSGIITYYYGDAESNNAQYPPEPVVKWAGLGNPGGCYGEPGNGNALSYDNDRRDMSFAEIADIIESRPKRLFKETE